MRRKAKESEYRKEVSDMAIYKTLKAMWEDESGIGTVEMILILVVLIGLVLIFKKQLTTLVNNIFKTITTESGKV